MGWIGLDLLAQAPDVDRHRGPVADGVAPDGFEQILPAECLGRMRRQEGEEPELDGGQGGPCVAHPYPLAGVVELQLSRRREWRDARRPVLDGLTDDALPWCNTRMCTTGVRGSVNCSQSTAEAIYDVQLRPV